MKSKILLAIGFGIGYVLGTRAGREKYEKIRAMARRMWNDPRIAEQRHNAEDFVKDKAPDVAEFLADGAKKVVKQVTHSKSDTKSSSTKSPTKSSAAKKPAAKKSAAKKPSSTASATKSTDSK